METTPFGKQLTTGSGFIAGTTPEGADQILIWKADAAPANEVYASYFLLTRPDTETTDWVDSTDDALTAQSNLLTFMPNRAQFMVLVSDHPDYTVLSPVQ